MNNQWLWLTVFGMGIITYGIRLSMVVVLERVTIRPFLQRALSFVPPAVLSAIIFPEVLMSNGTLDVSLGNGRLLAGLIATAVAWRTKNVLWTIVIGMVTLWILQAIS